MFRHRVGGLLVLALSGALCAAVFAQEASSHATIDKPVKDFKLKNINFDPDEEDASEELVKLADFKDKAVVLMFISPSTESTKSYLKRMTDLIGNADDDVVEFVAVRCSAADSTASIKKFIDGNDDFDIKFLNDSQGTLTKYFNVHKTPTFALIDKKGMLRYFGAFDDNADASQAKKNYLSDALSAIVADKDVTVKETTPVGTDISPLGASG